MTHLNDTVIAGSTRNLTHRAIHIQCAPFTTDAFIKIRPYTTAKTITYAAMTQRPPRPFEHDDFEQFEAPSPATSAPAKRIQTDDANADFEDSYRTRKPFAAKTVTLKPLTERELALKINARAVGYLSRREYSRDELFHKLTSAFEAYPSNDAHAALIEQVLAELARANWQSDTRYAEQITKVKGARFGVARLKQEFKQHGLSDELVQRELNELKATELERATLIWRNKFGQAPQDMKERAKQARFMASRGFGFDIVRQIIKGLEDE